MSLRDYKIRLKRICLFSWADSYTEIGDDLQLTLGEIAKVQTGPFGSQLHASDYTYNGVPVVMPLNIGENRIIEDQVARTSVENAARLSRHKLQFGDIIYSRRGDIERRALIRKHEIGWLCGTGCLLVRPNLSVVDPEWLSFWLGTQESRQFLVRHAVGATMLNLNTGILASVPVKLPSLEEQRKIADILGSLDDKIELNRQMNATLEEMARALFQSWFVDFDPVKVKACGGDPMKELGLASEVAALFPDSFHGSDIGDIPKNWNVTKIGDFVSVFDFVANGSFESLRNNVELLDTPDYALYIRTTDYNSGFSGKFKYVSKASFDFLRKSVLHGHEIIISNVGNVGTVFRPPTWLNMPMTLGSNAIALNSDAANEYLYGFFKGSLGQDLLSGITTGSAQPKFNKTSLRSSKVLVPPKDILVAFAAITEVLTRKINLSLSENATLAETRDYLLPRLLSGEVAVGQGGLV